jgi:branched-chain amino acid transport system substrate-binding protein
MKKVDVYMKNKKKTVLKGIAISTLAALTLAACSSQSSSSSSTNTSGSGSAAKDTKTIKIAQIGPFSGNAASLGNWDTQGIMMVVDEVNKNGGIHGKKIEVEKIDDQGNPTVSVNAAQKVVGEDIVAAFATPLSTTTLASLQVFNQAKIPQMTAGQDPTITTKGSQYIFRYNASSAIYDKTAAEYVVKKLGKKKIAIITNSGAYGKGERDNFTKALKDLGVDPVADEVVAPDAKDFTAQLTNIKAKNPEVLYMGVENIQMGLITKQAVSLGLKAQRVGGSSADPIFVKTAGVENAEGTIFTTQYIPTANDQTKAFNEAVKKKYGVDGEFHIAKAYDGAKMLVQAMNNAYPKLDGATIAKELKKLNYKGITGDYHFNTTGEGSNRAQLGIIKNGNAELLK